jgi:hypothetical protein
MVIDRKVVLTDSMNFTSGTAQNFENVALIALQAVAAAYTAHWQNRQAVSVPFTRRKEWCRKPEVADLKWESPSK